VKSSLASGGHILQDMPLLLAQACNDGQHAFDKVTTCTTLGPKAAFAPQHDGTQGALGTIIGGVHTLLMDKGPQRRLVLKQRATQSSTFRIVTYRPLVQESVDLHAELRRIDPEGGALQRAIAHPVPPVKELSGTHP